MGCKPIGVSLRRFKSYPVQYDTRKMSQSLVCVVFRELTNRGRRQARLCGMLRRRTIAIGNTVRLSAATPCRISEIVRLRLPRSATPRSQGHISPYACHCDERSDEAISPAGIVADLAKCGARVRSPTLCISEGQQAALPPGPLGPCLPAVVGQVWHETVWTVHWGMAARNWRP